MKNNILLLFFSALITLASCVDDDSHYSMGDSVEDYARAVVLILCPDTKSQGSAVSVRRDGYLITNQHVVKDSQSCVIKTTGGAIYSANVKALHPVLDLALVKVDGSDLFKVLEIGDSDLVRQGTDIIAIGNPRGLESTVTRGVISNAKRKIPKFEETEFFQFDAASDFGSSGGALLLKNGNLIGITTLKFGEGQSFNSAIKINDVLKFINENLEGETEMNETAMQNIIPSGDTFLHHPFIPFLTDTFSRVGFFIGIAFFFWIVCLFFFNNKIKNDGSPIDGYCTWGGVWMFLVLITAFVSFADLTTDITGTYFERIHIFAWVILAIMTIFIFAMIFTVKGKKVRN
jgi:hypothetical protein